jgi:hypothetical protein
MPYTWDPRTPEGPVDSIKAGAAAMRTLKSTLQTILTDGMMAAFPADNLCTLGWPRVNTVPTADDLEKPVKPYGRLTYVADMDQLLVETKHAWIVAYPPFDRTPTSTYQVVDTNRDGNGNLAGGEADTYGYTAGTLALGADNPAGGGANDRDFRAILVFSLTGLASRAYSRLILRLFSPIIAGQVTKRVLLDSCKPFAGIAPENYQKQTRESGFAETRNLGDGAAHDLTVTAQVAAALAEGEPTFTVRLRMKETLSPADGAASLTYLTSLTGTDALNRPRLILVP